MAVLGLRFCARAFSSCGKRGPLFIAVKIFLYCPLHLYLHNFGFKTWSASFWLCELGQIASLNKVLHLQTGNSSTAS